MATGVTTTDQQAELKTALVDQARQLGFTSIGFVGPDAISHAPDHLNDFLKAGHHGEMAWLAERAAERSDPSLLWPDVRSVIMMTYNYGPTSDPLAQLAHSDRGAISVYAQGDDYHDVIKKKLKILARWLVAQTGHDVKVFVDTAPVMEKPLAQAAGLGWQGKHTNLVSRELGSWAFIGSIMTSYHFAADAVETSHCGSCQACLDICPTQAFPVPYQIDARRCISYLTIEYDGIIPLEFRKAMGNRIYGCDDCLAVCPWNKYAQAAQDMALQARDENQMPLLRDLARLDDEEFRQRFRKSPIKRIGRHRFIRNVLIALGNRGEAATAEEIETVVALLSDANAMVRAHAVWGLSHIDLKRAWREYENHRAEQDEGVMREWARLGAPDTLGLGV